MWRFQRRRRQQRIASLLSSNVLLAWMIMSSILCWCTHSTTTTTILVASATTIDDVTTTTIKSNYDDNDDKRNLRKKKKDEGQNIDAEQKKSTPVVQERSDAIKRVWDICPEGFPALHAIIHERNTKLKSDYETVFGKKMYGFNGGKYGVMHDNIQIKTISEGGSKFALLTTSEQEYPWTGQGSVWNDKTGDVIRTTNADFESGKPQGTLVPPLIENWEKTRTVVQLDGDYVAYTGWMYGNLGHFIHDNLPTIAYLKSIVPESTKFILGYDKLHERILRFIDADFVENRVKWIDHQGKWIFQVTGTMTVTTWNSPMYMGCCSQFEPLRQWMATSHPVIESLNTNKKYVIFYTRSSKDGGGQAKDNHHGRIVNPELEKELLRILQEKLDQYGRQEEIYVFDGQEDGQTMSIEHQFMYFRSASVIIGPHGSGLGGNYIWTNPNPQSCDDRVQILEFLPGEESKDVQALHASYFMQYRKWPFEYHQIMYNSNSTRFITEIDIENYIDALDTMFNPQNRTKYVNYHTSSAWEPHHNTMSKYNAQVKKAYKANIDSRIK